MMFIKPSQVNGLCYPRATDEQQSDKGQPPWIAHDSLAWCKGPDTRKVLPLTELASVADLPSYNQRERSEALLSQSSLWPEDFQMEERPSQSQSHTTGTWLCFHNLTREKIKIHLVPIWSKLNQIEYSGLYMKCLANCVLF